MKVKEKVRRDLLKKLADGLKTLDNSEYCDTNFVSEFDENGNGKVCCALGWAPRFIPESGLFWDVEDELKHENDSCHWIKHWEVFNVTMDWGEFMFFGGENPNGWHENDYEDFGYEYATLEQAIRRIEYGFENATSYTEWLEDREVDSWDDMA